MIQLNVPPQAGFDQPLALLQDCHRRIERFLRVLMDVNQQASRGALNSEQRRALQASLDYFAHAAPKHTLDEEESLFPRLREIGGSQVRRVLWKMDGLEKDHDCADRAHARIEVIGRGWLGDGRLSVAAGGELDNMLRGLRESYQRHIGIEDSELFPLAGRVLRSDMLEQMGREMARRRGLNATCRAG